MTYDIRLEELDLTLDDLLVGVDRVDPAERSSEVAIVGMAGRAGATESLDEFWTLVRSGRGGPTELSPERMSDVREYLRARGVPTDTLSDRLIPGTRLRSVSEFDHRFFGMSRGEAKYLDPNQRIFLQTAWEALEDAGQLSGELAGGRIGVFVGMSDDFGVNYREVVQTVDPQAPDVSVAGNVKSIIASRLAHILDLKGPAMLIDTACSSGLVAVHAAYRAIVAGDCDMAIVGGAKFDLIPLRADSTGVGVKEIRDTVVGDHVTRTFDSSSDGTSPAEGAFVFVLKALDDARRDRDTVRAVIVGGAVNQDGASNGITAPNADAQADLIDAALTDAGLSAEDIQYIEAHGTGTKLGDPIEVSGITKAFARRTSHKQFCGIGSVKTNVGHMDHVAGLAGLAKLVRCLQDRVIPASLHFQMPNQHIDFSQTPLYVVDRTMSWPGDAEPAYAGISSFGLSGTNCHLVLRSAGEVAATRDSGTSTSHVLPLSAHDRRTLRELASRYTDRLADSDASPDDVAFTASVGRLHRRARAAFVFDTLPQLVTRLRRYVDEDPDPSLGGEAFAGVFVGDVGVVLDDADRRSSTDLTVAERVVLDEEANLLLANGLDLAATRRVAALYAQGAQIEWQRGASAQARRIPLPTTPFAPTRCWVERTAAPGDGILGESTLFTTVDQDVVACRLSDRTCWALDEHRLQGVAVLPGTALIELMVAALGRLGHPAEGMVLRNIVFETPLAVRDGAEVEIHVVVRRRDHRFDLSVAAHSEGGDWVRYAQAEFVPKADVAVPSGPTLDRLREQLTHLVDVSRMVGTDHAHGLEVGERWNGSLVSGRADAASHELLYELRLPEQFVGELDGFFLHPALMDTLVNAANNIDDEGKLYLPLSYGRLTLHRALPQRVFAHFRKREDSIAGKLVAFEVAVYDERGRTLLTIENYCVKSVTTLDLGEGADPYGHARTFAATDPPARSVPGAGQALVVGRFGADLAAYLEAVRSAGYEPVEVGCDLAALKEAAFSRAFAFGLLGWSAPDGASSTDRVLGPASETASFLRQLAVSDVTFERGIVAVTRSASAVTPDDEVDPGQAGLSGLLRVAREEYTALGLRCVDLDGATSVETVVAEATGSDRVPSLAYRGGVPYVERIERCPLPRASRPIAPRSSGAVIVTGGSGALGRAAVARLATRGFREFVMVGSPNGQAFDVEAFRAAHGLSVCDLVRLDMGSPRQVDGLVADVRRRHGRIAGVLHLAGRAGTGYLATKERKQFLDVFNPKALGALCLHEATLGDDLDFFVAFSSVASIVAEPGQADYTAANRVLDGLMEARRRTGLPGVSLQWPAWREIGMATDWDAVNEDDTFAPLDTDEALDLLERVMTWDDGPAVLMPGRGPAVRPSGASAEQDRSPSVRRPPANGGIEVEVLGLDTVGDIERAVAAIWAETLDVDAVSAADDFNGLGGNSLLATHMLRLYENRFPGAIDIADLFRFTTFAQHVDRVKAHTAGRRPAASERLTVAAPVYDLDRTLELLERGEISLAESQNLI